MFNKCLQDKDYELLKIVGASKKDDLPSIYGKINKHICYKHKKGAVVIGVSADSVEVHNWESEKDMNELIML